MHLALLLTITAAVSAQTFESASVKVSQAGAMEIKTTPGNLTMRHVGFGTMFLWAYKVPNHQIANGELLGTGYYDIVAKASGAAKTDEMRRMLQNLMAERFKLALHRETREMPAFLLTTAKSGSKLKPSAHDDGIGMAPYGPGGKIGFDCATIDQLTTFLAGPLGHPVLDRTGLRGHYDFELDISEIMQAPAPGESRPDTVSVFQSAVGRLGLKLESAKAPVEMLVIDRISKTPVEN
jgi:uncharacterized protein (TIGR03435 family)